MRKVLASLVVVGVSTTVSWSAERDPLHIIVSLKDQHMTVYRGSEQITQSNISSGKTGHDTPTGIFSVLQKNRHHRSNIYSGAPMPFMQRLTWSGIALHASNSVPAYPASHGCVRLPHSFAAELFKLNTRGAHVIIEDETRPPQQISHTVLFQPEKVWKTNKKYDGWVNTHITVQNSGVVKANPKYPSRIFITRRTYKDDLFEVQRLLNKLGFDAGEVDGLMGNQTWTAITAFQKQYNMKEDGKITSKLIDELYINALEFRPKNGRILVRQHHKQIYEGEITIKNPKEPLGSHLISTVNYSTEDQKTDWVSVSLNDRVQGKIHLRGEGEIDTSSARRSVSGALERIEMDNVVRKQISKLLTVGSSITISDNGMSIETGEKGTDFIVLTKPKSDPNLIAVNVSPDING